jgi:transposase
VIGEHLAEILRDEEFAEMYEPTGRVAIWPSMLAMVTLCQFREDVPDREAARMVATRIDWKYALCLPLDYAGFDFTVLSDFRRILEHGREALIFEAILGKVKALGFIKKRGKARTDSIAVLGAVRSLSVLETVTEAMRVAVRAIERADALWAERQLPASFKERYARTPDYRSSAQERRSALLEAGRDASWLLGRLEETGKGLGEMEEPRLLRKVWGQRYELAGG